MTYQGREVQQAMSEELAYLRKENHTLKAKIAGLEHREAEMVRKHRDTYELNEVLQNRLRAHGLSPYMLPTEQEVASENCTQSPDQPKLTALTANMLTVLREVIEGRAVDHGRHTTPRERAGRGRTLDKLKERGLLDAAYQPTDDARSLVARLPA